MTTTEGYNPLQPQQRSNGCILQDISHDITFEGSGIALDRLNMRNLYPGETFKNQNEETQFFRHLWNKKPQFILKNEGKEGKRNKEKIGQIENKQKYGRLKTNNTDKNILNVKV